MPARWHDAIRSLTLAAGLVALASSGRAAWARDPHEKVAERVIELLDVGQHAHGAWC